MFEAYKIAVKISLTNNVSSGLVVMAGQFKTLHKDVSSVNAGLATMESRLASIKRLGLVGGAMAGVGFGALALMRVPYEDAKRLEQAKTDFSTLNLSAFQNSEAYAKAASMSHKILGTNITDNLKGIHDLHTAFGDLEHAIKTADDFAKFSFIAKVKNDGKPVEGLVYNAAKALEHRGGKVMNDDAAFRSELDLMERVYLGSRGKVNPSEFFHASQTGKLSYTLMDKEELYGPFAAFMQTKTGATAGTANMTLMSSLVGGHLDNKAKGFLSDLGLWQEGVSKKRVAMMAEITNGLTSEERKSMGFLTPSSGGLKDEFIDLVVHRPSKLAQEVLAPAIRKKYGLDLPDEAVATMVMQHFNRNTSGELGEYIVNALKFKKDAAIFKNSMGIGAAYENYLKSPEGAEVAAAEGWKNLMTVIGSVYLPKVTSGLLAFAKGLSDIGGWMERHEKLTDVLVLGFGGLAGAMAIGGTIKLVTAGFQALGLALAFPGVGGVGGAVGIRAVAAAIAGGGAGTLVGGLIVLGGVVWGLSEALKAVGSGPMPGRDPKDHVGMKFVQTGRGNVGMWVPDSDDPHAGQRFIKTGRGAGGQWINNKIVLPDGRVLASVVTEAQTREAQLPQSGISRFDGRMSPTPVGASGR